MTQDQLHMGLRKDVRSLLISAKHGLTPEQLKRDYQTILGYPMPLRLLGFRNVLDMVKEMPDVVHLEFQMDGNIILKAIGDESTKGIEELVSKQRDHKPKPNKGKRKPGTFQIRYPHHQTVILPRRGQIKPTLPAQLRSQLKQLLSHGPVRLSELESRYMAQFGRPLQITQYGFYSISEMLATATDFIVTQQSRTGSQLLLRSPVSPQKQTYNLMSSPSKQLASPFGAKEKPVTFSPKASTPPEHEKNHQDSQIFSAVPSPDATKGDQSFEEKVLKLEEELRQKIFEKGTAGTVNRELKDKLRKVVAENSNGISIHNLPKEYKRMYGEELPLAQCGFLSVTEMVGALSDTFSIQPGTKEGKNHWIVMEFKPNDTPPTEPELSTGHGTTSSPAAESPNPSRKAYYFSCTESAWERDETEQSTDSQETDTELRVTNKTIHQMVDLFPELMVNHGAVIPLDAVRCQKLKPPTRRKERELVPVLVEQAASPSHFYIRFSQNNEARALENMMIEMRSCYSCPDLTERYRLPDAYVRLGQVCCVAPRDMWFYRVVIHEVLSPTEVKVYYVDFGDITKVERNSLRFLKACYADLPAQAVPSVLAGVRPITSIWTQSAITFFQRMCCEHTLVAAVHSYQENFLLLFLCDTNTEEDVYIHLALQKEGHALPCSSAYGLGSGKFSPLSFYLGDDQLEDLNESVAPSTPSPDTKSGQNSEVQSSGSPSLSSPQAFFGSENGENNCPSKDVDPVLDLPELEFISVPEVNNADKREQVNPFEVLQGKDPSFCSEWDQGWTAENKTYKMNLKPDIQTEDGLKSKLESSAPTVQAVLNEPQRGGSKGELKPVTSRCSSPHTPSLMQINCSHAGVPVYPVLPPLSNFMLRLFNTSDSLCSNSPFQRHTSPLALRPAARLSAGANILNWCSNQTV
ncbi:tudor domain-containing protein 5-like [Myxocyprinus asiaticus]|uniref:tudor domain-containing protein 5-like n=1 Tax=Myxocyprinus asiaticus TaxID=70543 RepID=UPI002221515C|nr:tudor domain-containing protein 5-like [Myxocyprinus asiaticus]